MDYGQERRVVCTLALALCVGCAGAERSAYVDLDVMLAEAAGLRAAGKHSAAGDAYARFAKDFETAPAADYAAFTSGEEYLSAGRYDDALEAFRHLHARFRHSEYLNRARLISVEVGKKLLNRGQSQGKAFLELATEYGRYDEVAAEAHLALGHYYYSRGQFLDAQYEFEAVVREHPRSRLRQAAEMDAARSTYRLIDRPARNMSYLDGAQERFKRLRAAPLSADQSAEVDDYLNAIAELGAEAHLAMAEFYLKQGVIVPALAHLREVLEKYPDARRREPVARELMVWIDGKVREAMTK